jgi:hypothetical protein
MSGRDEWRKVRDSEVQRSSALSYDQLDPALRNLQSYTVELDSKKYQVEVEIVENSDKYVSRHGGR